MVNPDSVNRRTGKGNQENSKCAGGLNCRSLYAVPSIGSSVQARPWTLGEEHKRALEIVGKFRSARRDVLRKHDAYLAETFGK